MTALPRRAAIRVFLAFAFAYFFSALIRSITATLSPTLTLEFNLNASDLGLLAGGYFLGFSSTQLPLGRWLDQSGPKRVLLCFLSIAVLGCLAFSFATSFGGLLAARILCGVGVSACLMAPLTGYRRWLDAPTQLRANSWMLMSGSLGMVMSTLPVQWLMPLFGWRPLFWGLGALVLLAMGLVAWQAPGWHGAQANTASTTALPPTYAAVWRHAYFRRMVPVGFFCYGGLLAMQTLWVVPWMTKVAGFSANEAATGFFWINVCMLLTFWAWGLVNPGLARRGLHADWLIARGLPLSFIFFAILLVADYATNTGTIVTLSLYCMACSFVSLSQPAVGMAFAPELAGRALSAYNLVLFGGIFAIQWGIGLAIDGFRAIGFSEANAFRAAFLAYLVCCIGSYLHFVFAKRHNEAPRFP